MAFDSKIEWTHHTGNLWWGCTNVHRGCDNCYAEAWANRYGVKWGNDSPRKEIKGVWASFLSMQAKAAAKGEIHRVFVGSMMDIFEKPMPAIETTGELLPYKTDAIRDKFFNEIVPNCPDLLFLLLTKRPSNINKYIPPTWIDNPPKNVMFGGTIVDEKTANDVYAQLTKVNGRKFYSVEPQLDFIDFSKNNLLTGIDWLIQGGESGSRRRGFDVNWALHTKEVCQSQNIPYFFKQIDKIKLIPDELLIREFPKI